MQHAGSPGVGADSPQVRKLQHQRELLQQRREELARLRAQEEAQQHARRHGDAPPPALDRGWPQVEVAAPRGPQAMADHYLQRQAAAERERARAAAEREAQRDEMVRRAQELAHNGHQQGVVANEYWQRQREAQANRAKALDDLGRGGGGGGLPPAAAAAQEYVRDPVLPSCATKGFGTEVTPRASAMRASAASVRWRRSSRLPPVHRGYTRHSTRASRQ